MTTQTQPAFILDTETTSIQNPEVIELAFQRVNLKVRTLTKVDNPFHEFFKPEGRISLGAMATHHIIPEDLEGKATSSVAREKLPAEPFYLIGHNIDFDWKALGEPVCRRIDTLALARYLLPDLESHTQTALMYHFLDHASAREQVRNAHSALADIEINFTILHHLLHLAEQVRDLPSLWELSERARVPSIMPFGKHKGELIKSIPPSYKAWLLRQPNIDPYLEQALRSN